MVTKVTDAPDRALEIDKSEGRAPNEPSSERMKQLRERFQVMQTYWSVIHNVALEDDRFIAGDQWPQEVRHDREEAGRPILTYNLLPSFTRQIVNKVRQERPQVKVTPVEGDKNGLWTTALSAAVFVL